MAATLKKLGFQANTVRDAGLDQISSLSTPTSS
jgi:hypothetical protein